MIHPTAVVHPSATLADDVEIGAFSLVEAGASLGAGVRLAEHVVVRAGVTLGEGCDIDSFCAIGGQPQMRGTPNWGLRVEVGARTVLREGVTISRPSKPDGATLVGAGCYLMANCHVGHDSNVGDRVTIANNVMLAGHVTIDGDAFLGGGAGIHQFVRIGSLAMVGGNASISYDVPPFTLAAERNEIRGLNVVGLRRAGYGAQDVHALKRSYHELYWGRGDLRVRAEQMAAELQDATELARRFLAFFLGGKRGFVRPRGCLE